MKGSAPRFKPSDSADSRSVARDARKGSRKEKERAIGKQRLHDRRVKESSVVQELPGLGENPVGEKLSDEVEIEQWNPLQPSVANRIAKEIRLYTAERVTRCQRLLAFAMARHKRLGADSPAYGVSKDVCSVIARFVPGVRLLVGGGLRQKDDDDIDNDKRLRFHGQLSKRVVEW